MHFNIGLCISDPGCVSLLSSLDKSGKWFVLIETFPQITDNNFYACNWCIFFVSINLNSKCIALKLKAYLLFFVGPPKRKFIDDSMKSSKRIRLCIQLRGSLKCNDSIF